MNERDKELANVIYGSQWTTQDLHFAALIRADAMEAATRAANVSWSLVCKKMVELEREACAKVCEEMAYVDPQPHHYANAIRTVRARGNT